MDAEVDIPEALIDAHRNGNLVIFVGAGASRDSPSDLPDFGELAADIWAESLPPGSEAQPRKQPDELLGDLKEHHQVDVHARVAARIGVPSSRPNRLHEAIVALAAASPPVRIVTTNYDLHLSTVLEHQGLSVPEYTAPALPLGDDFEGLVYLHGCLRQTSDRLIVTDVDFGRAYLRDAWATRFLERMFSTYTVVFVGYSHSDVVVSYLAKGLRPTSIRFALTPETEMAQWQRRLGVTPVPYPLASESHEALGDAVARWGSRASMGLLAHRQWIRQLVTAPSARGPEDETPAQRVPEEEAYLRAILADETKVPFFVEYARGPAWLSWAATRPEFKHLFDPAAQVTACTRDLACWFAQHYVMVEDHTEMARSVVSDGGDRLAPTVWSAIGHHLHMRHAPRPPWLRQWLQLLIQNAPRRYGPSDPWLEYALTVTQWPEDRTSALLLFDHLCEPQADPRHFGVNLRGELHWLNDAWQRLFLPNLADAAAELIVICDHHLRRAHQLMVTSGSTGLGWGFL